MRFRKSNHPKIISKIRPIARELTRIKRPAEALGIFTNDRELLECTAFDLVEDVSSEGFLITYYRNSYSVDDCGLRFEELKHHVFRCPVCKTELKTVIL
jgi:hypothetical protein